MRILRILLAVACLSLSMAVAQAAHTQVQLQLADDSARPGDTVLVGVHLKMEPGWHTYWKNPGSAGDATKIVWQLPPGVTAGEIQWPLPTKLPPEEVITYGYENEVVLLVPLKLAADLKPGPLQLNAKVSWLECKEQCIPGKTTVQTTLNIGTETKPSADAALLDTWTAKVPRPSKNFFLFDAYWDKKVDDDTRALVINASQMGSDIIPIEKADFFPDASDTYEIQGPTEVPDAKNPASLRKLVKKFSGDWPAKISGVYIVEGNQQRMGFEMSSPIAESSPKAGSASTSGSQPTTPFSWTVLLSALGSAFLGGLILNIMPCVLPVIALKIFSFVKQSGEDPKRTRQLGLIYALGILFSFLVLAGFLIALQKAGHIASWGSQMQNKNFVLGMTILVTLVALNLFGLFEVTLGSGAMTAANSLSSKNGPLGAFFNGVLATALAIPCTAPFLTFALAFALAQPPVVIVLTFAFIAFGLAAPYVLLTWNTKLLKFMPKPGAWMQQFKIALGFPMLGTVIYLYMILLRHLNKSQSLWFGIFLVALALGAWIWGEFVQRGSARRVLAAIIALAIVTSAGVYAATRHEGLTWAKWSTAEVEKARSAGRPVLVDFTADWCVTCQANLHSSIDIASVREKLAENHVAILLADFTLEDEKIAQELHRFGRDAVPLVVVFPKNPASEPIVLPPLLTPQIVLNALDQAAK